MGRFSSPKAFTTSGQTTPGGYPGSAPVRPPNGSCGEEGIPGVNMNPSQDCTDFSGQSKNNQFGQGMPGQQYGQQNMPVPGQSMNRPPGPGMMMPGQQMAAHQTLGPQVSMPGQAMSFPGQAMPGLPTPGTQAYQPMPGLPMTMPGQGMPAHTTMMPGLQMPTGQQAMSGPYGQPSQPFTTSAEFGAIQMPGYSTASSSSMYPGQPSSQPYPAAGTGFPVPDAGNMMPSAPTSAYSPVMMGGPGNVMPFNQLGSMMPQAGVPQFPAPYSPGASYNNMDPQNQKIGWNM